MSVSVFAGDGRLGMHVQLFAVNSFQNGAHCCSFAVVWHGVFPFSLINSLYFTRLTL